MYDHEPASYPSRARQAHRGEEKWTAGETGDSHWDISPDGQRFAMVRLEEASRPRQIEVVLSGSTELERLAPTQ